MTRIETIERTIYKYDELSESAQKTARDWYTSDLSYDWWDSVYEDFERVCEILGVELSTHSVSLMNGSTRRAPNIWFEGFHHQGGGSSFEGSYDYKKGAHKAIRAYCNDETLFEIADDLLALQKINMYRVTGSISKSGRYYSLSVDAYITDHINGGSDCADADIDSELGDIMIDLNSWLYSSLKREYEYLTSDESAIESIRANEYEFDENGNIA